MDENVSLSWTSMAFFFWLNKRKNSWWGKRKDATYKLKRGGKTFESIEPVAAEDARVSKKRRIGGVAERKSSSRLHATTLLKNGLDAQRTLESEEILAKWKI